MVGGVKLNLTESTSFVSFYIFTDHYLFQCLKVIFFGYFTSGRGARMAIQNFLCARHSLVSRFYYMTHHGWARKNIFTIEVLSWLENAIFSLVFANNRAILLVL